MPTSSGGHMHTIVDLTTGLPDGQLLVGVADVPTPVTPSGVVTMSNAGVFSLATGTVVASYTDTTISSANITATSAGALGHANGVAVVAAPVAGSIIEFLYAVMVYDYGGAGYATGGNLTINATGGSAITGVVSAANSLGATSDKVNVFYPLAVAGLLVAPATGLSLVAASAFTNGGSATGVVRVRVYYRTYATGL